MSFDPGGDGVITGGGVIITFPNSEDTDPPIPPDPPIDPPDPPDPSPSLDVNTYRFDLQTRGWWPLNYAVSPQVIYPEEGETLATLLMGDNAGSIHYMGRGTSDNGDPIRCDVITPSLDIEDTRAQKLWLDYMVDADPQGVELAIFPWMNNQATSLTGQTMTGSARIQVPFPLASTNLTFYRNFALEIYWSSAEFVPVLYEFQPNALLQPFFAKNFSTQFQSHGYTGFGSLRDGWVVYVSTSAITFEITATDGIPTSVFTVTLPSTTGLMSKQYLVFPSIKGQMFRYNMYSDTEFVLFTDETIIRSKEWASPAAFSSYRPFIHQTPGNLIYA